MAERLFNRRDALVAGGCAVAEVWLASDALAQLPRASAAAEVSLVGEPTRGYYANYDLNNFGPPALRKVNKDFVFPKDVDVDLSYGIDVSHHTNEVPWSDLKHSKVNYVYVKASQSVNGRDDKFIGFWTAAQNSGLPYGAFHFLTASVAGQDQGKYFLKRLGEVGGLQSGHLQPVIDLEWDIYGPNFKTVVVGKSPQGDKVYKDYWDAVPKSAIVATVNDCVSAIRSAAGNIRLNPVIYTNRSWWESHVPAGTVFAGCTVWISDYRRQSYDNNAPRSVQGHDYYLWQFTDRAHVDIGGKLHGPYDSNKLVFGGIERIRIA